MGTAHVTPWASVGGTQFAILICGHWIADPGRVLQLGQHGPCPRGDGQQAVIATPYDPIVHMRPGDDS